MGQKVRIALVIFCAACGCMYCTQRFNKKLYSEKIFQGGQWAAPNLLFPYDKGTQKGAEDPPENPETSDFYEIQIIITRH